ncbi:MAG: hypothetical protein LAT63_16595 [Marinobacter sp.]|nr:hypothetical protein [Marinobacter sp.]
MKKILTCLALSASLAVVGCNQGGGSSGVPEKRPSGTISGVAFDGLIINGDIRVYAWNGRKGELLGSGRTNSQGEYSVTLDQVASQPVLIEVTGGRYVEEASRKSVGLKDGDRLYALYEYKQGEALTTALTYYTMLATGLAEYMVSTGVTPVAAVREANRSIEDLIGINIRHVMPLEIDNAANATPQVTDGHLYGFATASISALTAWVSEQNNVPVHDPYNSIRFARDAYRDIRSDGRLDGRAEDGIVAQGVVTLGPEVYRHGIATNMLVMANHSENRTNLTPADVLPMAVQFNESNASMFGSTPIKSLAENRPVISNLSYTSGDVVSGTLNLTADIVDITGLEDIRLYVNGVLQDTRIDSRVTFMFDSTVLEDGINLFTVEARNVVGATTTANLDLFVANTGTTISDVSPANNGWVSGVYPISAKITDSAGLEMVRFILNGETVFYPQSLHAPVWELNTSVMDERVHTLKIEVKNNVGFTKSKEIQFRVDNTPPVISWSVEENSAHRGFMAISPSINDAGGLKTVEFFKDGELLRSFTAGPYIIDFNTAIERDGEKNFVIRAVDMAGNVSSLSRSVFFDNTPPQVSILSPFPGDRFLEDFYVTARVHDEVGVDTVEILVGDLPSWFVEPDDDGMVNVRVNVSDMENGNYPIRVIAYDRVGFSAAASSSVKLDHKPPALRVLENSSQTIGRHGYTNVTFEIENFDSTKGYRLISLEHSDIHGGNWSPAPLGSRGLVSFDLDKIRVITNRCSSTRVHMRIRIADSNGLVSNLRTVHPTYPINCE